MTRIAVDIVLLPDNAMTAQAIKVNAALDPTTGSRIALDGKTCLPHITLAMGCIEPSAVEMIQSDLQTTAEALPVGDLTVTGVVISLDSRNEQVSAFALAMTPALRALHERVMETMQTHATYDVTAEMLWGDEEVSPTSLRWISTFREKAAFGAFFPHITLGYGMVNETMRFPMAMTASKLAVCHLGNHCTCRRVLAAVTL
jgi:2'-5' RNA ligase